jgi:2Fe-2S ferredoxin
MTQITYIDFEGTERTVDANEGESIMETAINNSIPGIDAECGGACACATCHVYVDQAFIDKLPEKGDTEASMLEFTENLQDNSRLSCQIMITSEMDGLRVTTPESQT